MTYSTEFEGEFLIVPALKPNHLAYLRKFATTRRMQRDARITETRADPLRKAVGLPVGDDGRYFVGAKGILGNEEEELPRGTPRHIHEQTRTNLGVVNKNLPPAGQPNLWCQWIPKTDGAALVWDGNDSFEDPGDWLEYLIAHFFHKWNYTINGSMKWFERSPENRGTITVKNNVVTIAQEASNGTSSSAPSVINFILNHQSNNAKEIYKDIKNNFPLRKRKLLLKIIDEIVHEK